MVVISICAESLGRIGGNVEVTSKFEDLAVGRKSGTPEMGCPGKWNQRLKPVVFFGGLILTHTHLGAQQRQVSRLQLWLKMGLLGLVTKSVSCTPKGPPRWN